jgi:Cu(I)/Ag(I) efflux system membrane fusion protein
MKPFLGTDALKRFLAKHAAILLVVQVVIVFALGYAAHVVLSGSSVPQDTGKEDGSGDVQAVQEATLWTCSMHPRIRKSGPGKCPICEMDLVPVKTSAEDKRTGMRRLTVSPAARALMNVQTVRVEERYVTAQVRMVGKIVYDETRLKHITAWVPGRLDRLYVDYTGIQVKQGDHMVYIYSEELHAEQQVLIDAIRSARKRNGRPSLFGDDVDLVQLSREKLRLLGMTPEQIREI